MPERGTQKRTVGLALLASAAIVVLVALLVGTQVIDVGESTRPILLGVLVVTAILDVIMGWRFLTSSNA